MEQPQQIGAPPLPTHLIADNHDRPDPTDAYGETEGKCCFCSTVGPGQPAAEAINYDYFNDDPVMQAATGHVCASCAYCMQADRAIKRGHWVATTDRYERVSTGDLRDLFLAIRDGEYDSPIAVYVAERATISLHSYLWTPISHTADPLTFAFARRTVTTDLGELFDVVDAVERLRRHGFRLDDIRQGRPRVNDLGSIGRDGYRECDAVIDPYRETALLETALTISRSKNDQ